MGSRWALVGLLSVLVLVLVPKPLRANAQDVKVEGQAIAGTANVAGTVLELNGTGVRQVAWFKGYVAALYLRDRASTPEQVLAMAGPKRVQLRMLYDVPAKELSKAVHKGVLRNSSDVLKPKLLAPLAAFEEQINAVEKVRKGDVVDIDHDGAGAMVLSVNGAVRGDPLAGADLFPALLRAFVGERPYDDRMKAGLLGQPS